MEQQWEIVDGVWRETTVKSKTYRSDAGTVGTCGFGLAPIKEEDKPYYDDPYTLTLGEIPRHTHSYHNPPDDDEIDCLMWRREGDCIYRTHGPRDWGVWIERLANEDAAKVNRRLDGWLKENVPHIAVINTRACPSGQMVQDYALSLRVGREVQDDYGEVVQQVVALFFTLCVEKTLHRLVKGATAPIGVLYWRRIPMLHTHGNFECMATDMACTMRLAFGSLADDDRNNQ